MSASLPRKLLLTFDSGVSDLTIRQKRNESGDLNTGDPPIVRIFCPQGIVLLRKLY